MGFDTRYNQGSRAMESTVPTLGLGGMGVGPELTPDMFRPRQPSRQNSISRSGEGLLASSPFRYTTDDIMVEKSIPSSGYDPLGIQTRKTLHRIKVAPNGQLIATDDQINVGGYLENQLVPTARSRS